MNIKNERLIDTTINEFELAEAFYNGGFFPLVYREQKYNYETDEIFFNYSLEKELCEDYFLMSTKKGFICYSLDEKEKEVCLWSCYTYPQYRKQGNMTFLFKELQKKYPDKTLSLDTDNIELAQIAKKNGSVSFFRVKINDFRFCLYDFLKSDFLDHEEFQKWRAKDEL